MNVGTLNIDLKIQNFFSENVNHCQNQRTSAISDNYTEDPTL